MNVLTEVLAAVLPSVGVGLLFWYVIRLVIQADRRERQALARIDAEVARARRAEEQADQPADGRADQQTEPRADLQVEKQAEAAPAAGEDARPTAHA